MYVCVIRVFELRVCVLCVVREYECVLVWFVSMSSMCVCALCGS